jgi:hypothetical protein
MPCDVTSQIHRDFLVKGAIGQKSFNGTTFSTVAMNLTGVMPSGSTHVNHSTYA